MDRRIETEAADALLDVGISLPLFRLKIPCGPAWTLRVTMRRPFLGTQMRIAREFLRLGIPARQIAELTEDDEREFLLHNGRILAKMVALSVCRGYLSGVILAPFVAWIIRWKMPREYLIEAQKWLRRLRSTRDFSSIIVLTERMNPFKSETSRIKSPINGS